MSECGCQETYRLREENASLRADLVGMQGGTCESVARRLIATVHARGTRVGGPVGALAERLVAELRDMLVRLDRLDRENR